ncbi:MAG: hypothetical protein E6J10_11835 [Chloroflexi bacterium]|nr:MAG: hypothetical protein E6J10_11835 [Chloroflexota bacterium]
MTIVTHRGSPSFPTVLGSISPSTRDEMDAAVQALQSHKDEWVSRTVRERIALLDRLMQDFAAIAPRWVAACLQAKSVAEAVRLSHRYFRKRTMIVSSSTVSQPRCGWSQG